MALLRRERPELVLGFGGYASFPVLMAAKALNILTMIHEQNVVPGKANRWMACQVRAVALSFAETERYLPRVRKKSVTGNPKNAVPKRGFSRRLILFLMRWISHMARRIFAWEGRARRFWQRSA